MKRIAVGAAILLSTGFVATSVRADDGGKIAGKATFEGTPPAPTKIKMDADPVCAGEPARFRPGTPGRFYVYAIYCRNDRAMSQTTAWTDATGPGDPRIEQLFRQLFPVVFSEQKSRWAFNDPVFR